MTYALATLTTLGVALTAVVGLLWTLRRWADRYRQTPATMETDDAGSNMPPILNAEPADVDEWTTDVELWLRDHTTLNQIEAQLRDGLDETYTRFLGVLGVDEADLLDHRGFVGVHELVGAP